MKQRKGSLSTKTLNQIANNRRNKFIVVTVDETENWREDIAEKAKRIDGVYIIDLTKPTHLCELSVSYYAIFISNFFHNVDAWRDGEDNVTEELCEMERDNGGEFGCYFSGNSTFEVKKVYSSGTVEDAEEYERCNPTVC